MKKILVRLLLTIPLATLASLIFTATARAQITPDRSLGAESSVVNPNAVIKGLPSTQIDGGAIRGANLFHSFQEFNVEAGRGAYFSNPAGIQNILSRVTGSNVSNIFGKLGVLGNANLFLINPNGIIFGSNASLDVNGSFFAITASSVIFPNGFEFSATNPQAPPLLTINIPIGLRFRDNPGSITTNQSVLQVPSGNTLALVGGDVNLNGGGLTAEGGRVELGGLAAAGTVGLQVNGNNLSLGFPDNVTRADVSLSNGSDVNVAAGGGGSIAVNARNLDLTGGSVLQAGIGQGLGSVGSQAGDVNINATGAVTLTGSNIFNTVQLGAKGNSGDINVQAGSLSLTNGAQLSAGTFGQGNGGNVTINANTVSADGVGSNGFSSGAFSSVGNSTEHGAIGNGGNVNVTARSLSLTNGAALSTSTFAKGNAGNVNIDVTGPVTIAGVNNGFPSAIFSSVEPGVMGNGGNITISSGSLSLSDGGGLNASTSGQGNAGSVFISAKDLVSLAGSNTDIFSDVAAGGVGKGGDINIQAGSLTLSNGAELSASTFGQGDSGSVTINANTVSFDGVSSTGAISGAFSNVGNRTEHGAIGHGGNINITTGSLSLTKGAELSASTFGTGDAGNVTINANTVSFDGVGSTGFSSGAFSGVESGVIGHGGNVTVTARSLSLTNGAALSTSTFAMGNAGNINVDVTGPVTIAGISEIFSNINPGATGNGGNITISAGSLSLSDGGTLDTSTSGQGNAGRVFISAKGSVSLDNSDIFSNVEAGGVGKGGDIDISAALLSLTDGAQLQTLVRQASGTLLAGRGNAGNINIDVTGPVTIAGVNNGFPSAIFSSVEPGVMGNGGNITISSGSLSLSDGGGLNTNTSGQGKAGNVNINVSGAVNLSGFTTVKVNGVDSGFFNSIESIVGPGAVGNGGDITIKAGSLSMNDLSILATGTSGRGNAGKVSVQVDDSVTLTNQSNIRSNVEQRGVGIGGDIDITARSLTLTGGAQIDAAVIRPENGLPGGIGRAGNITVTAKDFVDISGVNSVQFPASEPTVGFSSGLFASADRGTTAIGPIAAGNITVTTGNFRLADGAVVDALTDNSGRGGDITINAKTFTATGGGQVLATARNSGSAGKITLNIADSINLSGFDPNFNQRLAQAGIDEARVGGLATDIVNNQGAASGIFANTTSQSTGKGGNLTINTQDLTVQNGATVTVSAPQAQAGNLTITAKNIRLDQGSLTAETGATSGGNITLQGLDLLFLRKNSLISAKATTDTANAGDITILAPNGFVVAARGGNNGSDIVTSASRGQGGKINITSQHVYGLAQRPAVPGNGTNDIDASSQFGVSGIVNINSPDVDPSRGLVELPVNVVDPTTLIAQTPCRRGIESSFTITGRGGLPPNPNQILASDNVRVDLVKPTSSTSNSPTTSVKLQSLTPTVKRLVPAQGWIFNDKGQVVLTAYDPTKTGPQRSWQEPASCASR